MISKISVKNLGCFDEKDYEIKFNKLNVIVGPNNSGKSMFLAGLNMLRNYSSTNQIAWNNEYCALQSNYDAVHGHDTKRIIELGVDYDNSQFARLNIQNEKIIRDEFIKNGKISGTLITEEHRKLVSQIWYFHPERRHIPFQTDIGQINSGNQPISPSGENVIQYLLERFNARDDKYFEVEEWIKAMDDQNTLLKTLVVAKSSALIMNREYGKNTVDVNMNMQGSGINNAIAIIAGVIFSPPNSTLIIEEPETFLHAKSAEKLVDLFNHAATNLSKQIIITTHSWNILSPYLHDLCKEAPKRGHIHTLAKPEDFKLIEFNKNLDKDKIIEYPLKDKTITEASSHFLEFGI